MPARSRFDESYFRRFYHGRGRTHAPGEIARLASGVCGLAEWLGVEVASVLDVGAGTGLWRSWFRRSRPSVRYRSVDVSPYACARYGHEERDISTWRARERFDLVVCHSVLQYLDAGGAARAIGNLGAMCRGLLYLEVITREDLAILDLAKTDLEIEPLPAAWWRRELEPHFFQVGAGLWASRRSGVRLYALEGPPGAATRR
jgi:SAM-dependent methyltransferase